MDVSTNTFFLGEKYRNKTERNTLKTQLWSYVYSPIQRIVFNRLCFLMVLNQTDCSTTGTTAARTPLLDTLKLTYACIVTYIGDPLWTGHEAYMLCMHYCERRVFGKMQPSPVYLCNAPLYRGHHRDPVGCPV